MINCEDFVMTPIKCPPPKIVAVKRSLKKSLNEKINSSLLDEDYEPDKSDLWDDEVSLNSEEFNNLSDIKDLIEFEVDEPLIDLSEDSHLDTSSASEDTIIACKNAKNSSTLLSLLELLENGTKDDGWKETTLPFTCAQDVNSMQNPSVSKTSVSSVESLSRIPLGSDTSSACATTGNDDLSSNQPSHPPENSSIAKNFNFICEPLASDSKISSANSEAPGVQVYVELENQKTCRDSVELKKSHKCSCEEKSSVQELKLQYPCDASECSLELTFSNLDISTNRAARESGRESRSEIWNLDKKENFFNHYQKSHQHQQQQQQDQHLKSDVNVDVKNSSISEQSDTNNNRESVTNKNNLDYPKKDFKSVNSVRRVSSDVKTKDDNPNVHIFLSPNTSQHKLPPRWFSSTNSLKEDSFEASHRLKRLEERFRGFSYTKKLLRNSKLFSKSEEILSAYGRAKEFVDPCLKPLNSSVEFPVTLATLSENTLIAKGDSREEDIDIKASSNNDISAFNEIKLPQQEVSNRIQSPESSSAESEEICKIFNSKDNLQCSESVVETTDGSFIYYEEEEEEQEQEEEGEEEQCEIPETLIDCQDDTVIGTHSVFNDLLFSNCEFDVQTFQQYLTEYDDEDGSDGEELDFNNNHQPHCCHPNNNNNNNSDDSDESDFYCDCLVEAVPLYHSNIMRETGGTLRGLLKKPNRPPPVRKNRVVFDETRNEFFEADYIILIREDCPYDEEDEEPCTCGDHELVRICCDEGCNCGYTDDGRTPPSPKFAPPIEFVDQATLSPPEGYKDGGLLDNALSGALGNHVFGAQHIQQLQVIQRLQQQRAAMLAARAAAANSNSTSSTTTPITTTTAAAVAATAATTTVTTNNTSQQQQIPLNAAIDQQQQTVCTECAECAECAAAKLMETEGIECDSQCSEEASPMEVPHVLAIGSLVPIQKSSPERRNQKEIIAGEERPKFLTIKQDAQDDDTKHPVTDKPPIMVKNVNENQTYVVETITMTTITEHRIIRKTADGDTGDQPPPPPPKAVQLQAPAIPEMRNVYSSSVSVENMKNSLNATIIPKFNNINGTAQAITGILKGGKLRKTDGSGQSDETNTTSDEETSSKRSVRFNEETPGDRQNCDGDSTAEDGDKKQESQMTDYVTHMTLKRHSSLFHNALRPNSAVRQLFPAKTPEASTLTLEALKAFDESKRGNLLSASQTNTSATTVSSNSTSPTPVSQNNSDTDTIKRTIERNALRRSLIKYEPKKKITAKDSTSLEERIRQLTCDIDEPIENGINEMERRDSPAGEENPQQPKYEKSFSPSSSASSSSSCSTGSTYKKITDLFNKDKRHEKILETDENPIVIIPQDCRCPAGPDIGMGVQIQGGHTQVHQPPPPPRAAETKRQFLSGTLAPLTACVAGQRDDFSYYMLAKPGGDRTSTASSQTTDQYSIGDIDAALQDDEVRKVAPDVIAGTPGQETDELASFAQQEANRTDRIKKRYSSETSTSAPASGVNSDDDEQNDYGFNKRPSVRGIKPRFGSTNEILQQMQEQLSQPSAATPQQAQQPNPTAAQIQQMQSQTLPRTNASGGLQVAGGKQQAAFTHHQHTASWSYYPEQVKKPGENYSNYYHLPAHARHSYHGHEAIYQNCHTMTVQQQTQGGQPAPPHLHQKLQQQTSQPQIQAIQAQQLNRFNQQYARSPTRRPESPPPLRNYHQTMVLIPYKPEAYANYGDPNENVYQRQHNIVEYQQVTQQTIRVPIGYPMQMHIVQTGGAGGRGVGVTPTAAPHYATLPRQGSNAGMPPKYSFPVDKSSMERGVPEGEAASVQQNDCNNMMTPNSCQDGDSQNGNSAPSAVYYAMNV